MKELSIEEKAKRYDELKVTAQELEHNGCFDKITLFDLFPELEESEDEKIRKELLGFCKNRAEYYPNDPKYKNISAWIAWLEKQGEQKSADIRTTGYWNVQEVEQKPAWSEEDVINYNYALAACIYYGEAKGYTDTETHQKTIDWLKSLRPQNNWKPSDEQMIAIQEAMNIVGILTITGSKINSLYQDLKKLKEG